MAAEGPQGLPGAEGKALNAPGGERGGQGEPQTPVTEEMLTDVWRFLSFQADVCGFFFGK